MRTLKATPCAGCDDWRRKMSWSLCLSSAATTQRRWAENVFTTAPKPWIPSQNEVRHLASPSKTSSIPLWALSIDSNSKFCRRVGGQWSIKAISVHHFTRIINPLFEGYHAKRLEYVGQLPSWTLYTPIVPVQGEGDKGRFWWVGGGKMIISDLRVDDTGQYICLKNGQYEAVHMLEVVLKEPTEQVKNQDQCPAFQDIRLRQLRLRICVFNWRLGAIAALCSQLLQSTHRKCFFVRRGRQSLATFSSVFSRRWLANLWPKRRREKCQWRMWSFRNTTCTCSPDGASGRRAASATRVGFRRDLASVTSTCVRTTYSFIQSSVVSSISHQFSELAFAEVNENPRNVWRFVLLLDALTTLHFSHKCAENGERWTRQARRCQNLQLHHRRHRLSLQLLALWHPANEGIAASQERSSRAVLLCGVSKASKKQG